MSIQETAYQNPTELPQKFDAPPKSHTGRNCLIGCLGMLLLLVVACGVGGWWVYNYLPGILIGKARDAMVQGVNESPLAEADKKEVVAQIDRVVDAYKAGEIDANELGQVIDEVAKSPVMASFIVYAMSEKYIAPSGLSDEEKADARLIMQRILRGIVEGKIDPDKLDLSAVTVKQPDGKQELKEKITDEELRQLLVTLKKSADDAEIPDEPYQVRIGEEVRKAVDRALAK
jgi:hypothetical protein